MAVGVWRAGTSEHPLARISTMTDTTLMPSRLWKLMIPEQRRRAASALWGEDEATTDQMQAARPLPSSGR